MAALILPCHMIVAFFLLASPLTSWARSHADHYTASHADLPQKDTSKAPRGLSTGAALKVLCIGDSITVGMADGNPVGENNGYRLGLYNLLTSANITAQFIGTQISGLENPQPRMEGYGWQTIDSILSKVQNNGIFSEQPDLVLIHAGTNDNDLPQNSNDPSVMYANSPNRLGTLIDYVLCQDPDAVVLVAKLIQNKYNQTQTDAFNAQVPAVVDQRYTKGYKVRMVDMSMVGGAELYDYLHPVAAGYADMANRWYAAISDVPNSWWSANSLSQEDQPAVCTSASMPGPSMMSTDSAGQTVMQDAIDMQFTLPTGMTTTTQTTTSPITNMASPPVGTTTPLPSSTPGGSIPPSSTAAPVIDTGSGNLIVIPSWYTSLILALIFGVLQLCLERYS